MRKNGATTNVFRSWIRFAKTDANAATTSSTETLSAIPAARNGTTGGSSRRARSDEQEEGRERDDAEVEVELREVVEEVAGDRLRVVALVADDRVARRAGRSSDRPAHGLGGDDCDRPGADERVQHPEAGQVAHRPACQHDEQQRREQDRRDERDGLRAGREAEPDEHEERRPARASVGFSSTRTSASAAVRNSGIEDVLRHHRARVDHRGHRHGEHRGDQRERRGEHRAGRAGTRGSRRAT